MSPLAARLRLALALGLSIAAACTGTFDKGPLGASDDRTATDATNDGTDHLGEPPEDHGPPPLPTTGAELPCEVENLLTAYCMGCHNGSPAKLAPMPLLTRADLLAPSPSDSSVSAAEMSVRRMRSKTAPMPPGGNVPEPVVAAFEAWVQAGTPGESCQDNDGPPPLPFEPIAPYAYTAKVKNLLTGLPPSGDELAQVTADPSTLKALIDVWMATPEFEGKLLAFFATAFQQNSLTQEMLMDQLSGRIDADGRTMARLLDNLEQSFARTALSIVKENRPFTETITGTRYMLTPALMSLLSLLDERHVNDALKVSQPTRQFDVITTGTAIPYLDSIDAQSPSYLHFSAIGSTNNCASTTRTSKNDLALFSMFMGRTPGISGCNPSAMTPLFADSDFTDWRMVSIEPQGAADKAPVFFDLPALRAATELSLKVPRVGFFTTPAFFANWATNDSNQMRVTTNQTLIVALGASFDGSDNTVPVTDDGVAAEHAAPGTACYACHKTLDPMRNFFRSQLTLGYHEQLDTKMTSQPSAFLFDGVMVEGKGLPTLAKGLAEHPRFASAWTQKLCYYANCAGCAPDDPELLRVAGLFKTSNFDFKTLVRELFSSPLVTGAANTTTFEKQNIVISVARTDHLCVALSQRLGIKDVCGLGLDATSATQRAVQLIAASLPADGYSRGSEIPVTLSDTSLFFRSATESVCSTISAAVVDAGTTSRYVSTKLDAALDDFVHNVMALAPGDPREATARTILRGHYDDALKTGVKPKEALKSTFVLACTAPSTVSVGL